MANNTGRPPDKGADKSSSKTPTTPDDAGHGRAVLDEIFDSDILEQVEDELRKESGPNQKTKRRYSETEPIDLPKLEHTKPINPWLWLLRQIKRLGVLIIALCAIYYGGRFVLHKIFGAPEAPGIASYTVDLPKESPHEALEDRELKVKLDDGRASLASSKTDDGLGKLQNLALDHPDTRQGQKAMLTLASTYRYNQRQPEQAIKWYRNYLSVKKKGHEVARTMIRLADLFEELGRKSEAHEIYQDMLTKFKGKKRFTLIAQQGIDRTKD